MKGYINGIDFINMEAERYWSFPSSYKGDKASEMKTMILGGDYMGAEKKDGMYGRFIKDEDGNCFMISRTESVTGEAINKIGHLPQLKDWMEIIPNGTCFLGEIYFPNNPGSRKVTTIMGCLEEKAVERQNKGEKLHYYIFDTLAYNGRTHMDIKAEHRFNCLDIIRVTEKNPYVEHAKYFSGEELENELARVRAAGGEGIVITNKESFPTPGKRTARKTLKIKTELDSPIDCFLTGNWKPATRLYKGDYIEDWMLWEDIRTGEKKQGLYYNDYKEGAAIEPISKAYYNGWASAVELGLVDNEGNIHDVAWISGITDDVKEGIVKQNDDWKYKVVMVNAMSIENDTKKFRHGRIVSWRNDKSWKDCEMTQLWDND